MGTFIGRDTKGMYIASHGESKTKLYKVWCGIKERCNNPNHKSYNRYGGRGISVCDEWSASYASFKEWANTNGYTEGLTIDRIDNNGNYEPTNCRFVKYSEQNRNYSRNHNLTYNGRTQCISDWANEVGVNRSTILFRLKSGKTVGEALENKDRRRTRWITTNSLI